MQRFLRKAPEELTPDDLEPILWKSYTTWGDWPSFAFYVPRLLEFYAQDRLSDAEMLFHKLLWPARPELIKTEWSSDPLLYVGERMHLEERRAIFEFVQAVARAEIQRPDTDSKLCRVQEAFAFLATFDTPIAPLIEVWKREQEPWGCGRFCLLVAECALRYDPARPMVETPYAGAVPVLPENAEALAALVNPAFVAPYLAEHADSAALFGPEYETEVGIAFDWAMAMLQHTAPHGKR